MKYLALLLALSMPVLAWSQVGVGTSTPDASAALELSATDKGFLPPRMTAAQRTAIGTPATGLMVYQTDGTAGLYVYNGSKWLHQASWYSIGTSSFMPSIPTSATSGALLNLGIGSSALNSVSTGDQNTAVGAQALQSLTSTGNNTAVGYNSLFSTVSSIAAEAQFNTAIGRQSGMNNIKGSYNTFLGAGSDASLTNLSNATAIGYGAQVSAPNTIQLGNADVTNVNTSGGITAGGSVGIGTTSPNASAALEISSTTKGFLPPRLTQTQINNINKTFGLVVYNKTTDNLQLCKRGTESLDANNTLANQTTIGGVFQSFTALGSGSLSSIEFYIRNPESDGSGQVYCELYLGATTSGTPIARSDTIIPSSGSSYNWEKLYFNTSNLVQVTANTVLTLRILPICCTSNFTWVYQTGYDSYAGGQMGSSQSGFFSNQDLTFKTYIMTPTWVNL